MKNVNESKIALEDTKNSETLLLLLLLWNGNVVSVMEKEFRIDTSKRILREIFGGEKRDSDSSESHHSPWRLRSSVSLATKS
jgi:hypothetical protein